MNLRTLALWWIWIAWANVSFAWAKVVVVYPEARGPLREVFRNIVQGIESQASVKSLMLTKNSSAQELNAWLQTEQASRVIALGRQAVSSLESLSPKPSVVVGAVRLPPDAGQGVSLVLQPRQLFNRLQLLAPKVRQVHVVYLQSSSDWLMSIAKQDAKLVGLDLVLYPVTDLRQGVARYVELLPKLSLPQDALWLPFDEVAQDQQVVLPMVLQAAWEQRFIVFSENLAQVERGVLFALYPDDLALGQRLASMASQPASQQRIELLQDVRWALNTRTAMHLGVTLPEALRRQVSLTFPAP